LRSCAASGGTANLDLAAGIVAHADKMIGGLLMTQIGRQLAWD